MNKRIPIFIALCTALAWANIAAQKGEPQATGRSLSMQPGQSAFVACFKINGEPDPDVEAMVRKTFEKQKRFNLVSDADAASFVFLVYTGEEPIQSTEFLLVSQPADQKVSRRVGQNRPGREVQ